MNFELKEDQKLIREMIKDFSNAEIKPVARSLEDKHEFPSILLKKLAEIGVLGMSVPAQYNGNKTDHLSLIIAIEEISRVIDSGIKAAEEDTIMKDYSLDRVAEQYEGLFLRLTGSKMKDKQV